METHLFPYSPELSCPHASLIQNVCDSPGPDTPHSVGIVLNSASMVRCEALPS